LIPVDRLHHLNVVARDLRATARGCSLVYGIRRWQVAHAPPYLYATATGTTAEGVTLRLVQPTGGRSTYSEFLAGRGEGVHGLCLTVLDEAALRDLSGRLRAAGVAICQEEAAGAGARRHHVDTRGALGFDLEVVVPGAAPAPVDEEWDLPEAARRPNGVPAIGRVWHVGVAVERLGDSIAAHERLLGLSGWRRVDFRPEPGSLERSTLDGRPVRHAFSLARAVRAGVELELIQPTVEPTHYRRELLDRVGEGIHHLLVLPALPEDEWVPLRAWMASIGAPVVMSGLVRSGAAEFFYLDTRRLVGGHLLEVICRYR
jgi:hypothetical protein